MKQIKNGFLHFGQQISQQDILPGAGQRFGADDIVDFTQGDPVEQIMELTGGEGVDAAVEAFGFPRAFEACLRVTKAGGRVSNIGYHGENPAPLQLPLDAFGLGMNDKSIHTGHQAPDNFPLKSDNQI